MKYIVLCIQACPRVRVFPGNLYASLSTTLLKDHPDPNPRDPYSHGSLVVGNSFPWVTHRRSPKLAWGHSRSRGKADFTFNSESRHQAQWARSVLPIHFYSGPHVQPLPCTATDGRSSHSALAGVALSLSLCPSSSSLVPSSSSLSA
jgi:hypothetical protein